MSDDDLFRRFGAHLRAVDPRNSADESLHPFVVFAEGSERSARFHVGRPALAARLRALTPSAALVWPDAEPDMAAFRLLSVHLLEALDTNDATDFTVTADGILPHPR